MAVETLTLKTAPGAIGDYGSMYAEGADVLAIGVKARADIVAHRFKRMLLFDRHSSELAHHRSLSRVKQDGSDHLSIHLLLKGGLVGGQPGTRRELKPGEILVFDTSQPMWSQPADAHYLTAWVARDQFNQRSTDLRNFGGVVLPEEACSLLGDFMRSVNHRAPTLTAAVADSVSRVVGDLLVATLSGVTVPLDRAVPDDLGSMLRQNKIEAFIMSRLSDPNLCMQDIEKSTGLSRSNIYRAFKDIGGVVEFIQQRRVVAVHNALRRSGETRSISSLAHAYGFKSESHCSRRFRDMYDTSPGQIRAKIAERPNSPAFPGPWTDSFSHWRTELY